MSISHQLGKKGEEEAALFLEKKGYKIMEKNWRSGRLELDLIAKKDQTLVFVEVKSRSTHFFGFPENAVNKIKQKSMARAAEVYLRKAKHNGQGRFDIISLLFGNDMQLLEIEHIPDAFYPYSGY